MKPSQILGLSVLVIAFLTLNVAGFIDWSILPEEKRFTMLWWSWSTFAATSIDCALIIMAVINFAAIALIKFGNFFDNLFKNNN